MEWKKLVEVILRFSLQAWFYCRNGSGGGDGGGDGGEGIGGGAGAGGVGNGGGDEGAGRVVVAEEEGKQR